MWDIVKVGLEDVAKTFGIEENLYAKYVEGEIKKDPDLMALTERRNSNFDWQIETPLGGAGTTLNACVLYCLIRHYRLYDILETGVSGGYYSAFILAALGKGPSYGVLESLELSDDKRIVGHLVPESFRKQWQLKMGRSSLEYFPPGYTHSDQLYCHDSLHTMSHMLKELNEFKKSLSDRFFIFIDDEKSDGFWQKCLNTGAFKKPGYDVKYISGSESRLQGHLGGFIKYQKL